MITVALREDALGPDHPAVAADRGVLAAVLLARGFPAEAAALLRSILTLFERNYGPEHHEVAVVLHHLGTASHAAGRRTHGRSPARRNPAAEPRTPTGIWGAGWPGRSAPAVAGAGSRPPVVRSGASSRPRIRTAARMRSKPR